MKFTAPPLTPERLYLIDKRRKDWDVKEREISHILEMARVRRYLGNWKPIETEDN